MIRSSSKSIQPVVLIATLLGGGAAYGYSTNDNWCDRDALGWMFNDADWPNRGIDPQVMEHDVKVAAAWWWDVQATLGFGDRQAGSNNSPFTSSDPGQISGLCQNEWSEFVDNPGLNAMTHWDLAYHPSCDTFGVNNDEWYMIVRTDRDGAGCGSAANWAFNKGDQLTGTKKPMYRVVAHEFGHALGLGHSTVSKALMTGDGVWWDDRLSADDRDGLASGLGEGKKTRSIQTAAGSNASDPTQLTFKAVNTVGSTGSALWMPAAAGNRAALNTGAHSSWEFALAWVDDQYKIHVATGKDGTTSDANVTLLTNVTTSFTTRGPPAIAVSPQGLIGIAWTQKPPLFSVMTGVHFAVSSDDGQTWTETNFQSSGFYALGGASLTYGAVENKWVLTWIQDRDDAFATNIAERVSNDSTGLSWNGTVYNLGDSFSMPTKQPAINCMREDKSACAMVLMSYWWGDKPIMTAGGPMNASGIQPAQSPIDLGVISYGFSNLAMTHGSGFYVLTYTNGLNSGRMMYSKLGDASAESNTFSTPREWENGPTSRSGFAAMWNYKKGRYRFFWRND